MIRRVSSSEIFFIGGDLNCHVGTTRKGLRWYMRVLDMTNRIKREKKILNFAVAYDLMVANTLFRKKNLIELLSTTTNTRSRSILSLLKERRDQTAWIVRLYQASVSSHNISFWWLAFIFRYASNEIKA
jgi:predicted transcriptional regulator